MHLQATSPRRPEPEYAEILEPAPLPDPGLVVALEGLGLEEGGEEREEGREGGEDKEEREEVEAEECLVCSERLPLVTYLPCSHRILCTECRWRQKLPLGIVHSQISLHSPILLNFYLNCSFSSVKVVKCQECRAPVLSKSFQVKYTGRCS